MKESIKMCKCCGESSRDVDACTLCGSHQLQELTEEEIATVRMAGDEHWDTFYFEDLWRKYVIYSSAFSPEDFEKMKMQGKITFDECKALDLEHHTPIYNEDGSLNIEATRKSPPQNVSFVASIHLPKCPTCGSTNVHKMTLGDKAGSILMLGIFSRKIGKQFKCDNCGYEW